MEHDPNNIPATSPGAKLDANKIRPHLVLGAFAKALKEVSLVGTLGASKYSDYGWILVPDGINRYTEAMQRHYLEECDDVMFDTDLSARANQPVHHAACVAWNALARLELMLREEQTEKINKNY